MDEFDEITNDTALLQQNETIIMTKASGMMVLSTWRVPPHIAIFYTLFYAAVFFLGLIGNSFVVVAVIVNNSLRSATDLMISSLALADLLVVIFCLPTTLLNNLLTEWQLGSYGCKLSTFINSTTSCASIFTLVGVTAVSGVANLSTNFIMYFIVAVWIVSGALASPNLIIYDQVLYQLLPIEDSPVAKLCIATQDDFLLFVIVNLVIAFLMPVFLICISYALIFRRVVIHTKQKLAVDNNARLREERVKLRIAQMMLIVVIVLVFVVCWTPLYVLYCYFFMASNRESMFFQLASLILRPVFQWLSLLSSSLNPLIYIAFSQKYRRAFHMLLLLPCRDRYEKFQRATRKTFRFSSSTLTTPQAAQPIHGIGMENLDIMLADRRYRSFDAMCCNYNNVSLDDQRKSSLQFFLKRPCNEIVSNEQQKLKSDTKANKESPLIKKIKRVQRSSDNAHSSNDEGHKLHPQIQLINGMDNIDNNNIRIDAKNFIAGEEHTFDPNERKSDQDESVGDDKMEILRRLRLNKTPILINTKLYNL